MNKNHQLVSLIKQNHNNEIVCVIQSFLNELKIISNRYKINTCNKYIIKLGRMIKEFDSELSDLRKEEFESFTMNRGENYIVPIPMYDIIRDITKIKELNIYDDNFFAEVYKLLVMEKSTNNKALCSTNNKATSQQVQILTDKNQVLSVNRAALYLDHTKECILNINKIVREFHLIENSSDYSKLIDDLKLSEIEARQVKEHQLLDKNEIKSHNEAHPALVSLLLIAVHDLINDDDVVDTCNGYNLQRNRIQAIKILLNLKRMLTEGGRYDFNNIKGDLLGNVEKCYGWKL